MKETRAAALSVPAGHQPHSRQAMQPPTHIQNMRTRTCKHCLVGLGLGLKYARPISDRADRPPQHFKRLHTASPFKRPFSMPLLSTGGWRYRWLVGRSNVAVRRRGEAIPLLRQKKPVIKTTSYSTHIH